jgi:C1A family cysteine protease
MRSVKYYGWRRDIPDVRDWRYSLVHRPKAIVLPEKVDLRSSFPPCWDQGELGSCTANATVAALEFNRIRRNLPFHMLSRLFLYYNSRAIEDSVSSDSGAQLRDVVSSAASQGICAEVLWPYDINKFAAKPPAETYAVAPTWKISEYSRLATLDDMLTCLASGHPFVLGFTVYESFESDQVAQTGQLPMPGANEAVVGGHAVCAVGYDQTTRKFQIRNSWSSDWGLNGYFMMPFDYATNPDLASDFWTIRV